jgi:hypothetical protein
MAVAGARIIGGDNIERALVDAFEIWASEDINDAHWQDQFKEEKWKYDGVTERKNGLVVTSPRDIYDIGELYKSGVDSFRFAQGSNGAQASWHWDATNNSGNEYAWYVHEGVGSNATARPFTDDISIAASFFRKATGKALKLRTAQALERLNAS